MVTIYTRVAFCIGCKGRFTTSDPTEVFCYPCEQDETSAHNADEFAPMSPYDYVVNQ